MPFRPPYLENEPNVYPPSKSPRTGMGRSQHANNRNGASYRAAEHRRHELREKEKEARHIAAKLKSKDMSAKRRGKLMRRLSELGYFDSSHYPLPVTSD